MWLTHRKISHVRKWSLVLMIGFSVVESDHLDLSPKFGIDICIYLNLFQYYLAVFFYDMPVNNEASVLTLST
jgi:hypothetical protein